MANELEYYGDPSSDSGLTIMARVYNSAGVQVGSDVSYVDVGIAISDYDAPIKAELYATQASIIAASLSA